MHSTRTACSIREAHPDEFEWLGRLVADSYARLPGMPLAHEQPEYYAMLRDVASRANRPTTTVIAAINDQGSVVGCVDFIADMRDYASGGSASAVTDAAGVRLLAVDPASRGRGIGKVLMRFCVDRARALGRARLILHTTRAMETAWGMYERMGFERFQSLDFQQGRLEVFGFELALGTVEVEGGRHDDTGCAPGNDTSDG